MLKETSLHNFTCYVHILCWLPLTEVFITRKEKQPSNLFSSRQKFGIADILTVLLSNYEFIENWHREGRPFVWVQMKLHLTYDTLTVKNALVKSAYCVMAYRV
jgi:hypothetical protein